MPGDEGRQEPSIFDTVLRVFASQAGTVVKEAAIGALPSCYCGEKAVPIKCVGCGKYACPDHIWVNPKTISAVCSACVAPLVKGVASGKRSRSAAYPWSLLGLDPSASSADVRRAFRRLSRKHHPDRGGDAGAFRRLRKAYEEALEIAKSREERERA